MIERVDIYIFLASSLIAVGAFIHSYLTSRSRAEKSAIEALAFRVGAIEKEQTLLKEQFSQLQIHDDLEGIHERINDISSSTSNMSGKMDEMSNTLRLIQTLMMSPGE